jgi:hypothetical protein
MFCRIVAVGASEIIYLLGAGQRRDGPPRRPGGKNSTHRGPTQGVRAVLERGGDWE